MRTRFSKTSVLGAWLCCVLLVGLMLTPTASAQAVTYIHTDALGSVVAETDEAGKVIKRYDYEPYGGVVDGPVMDGPGYTGHVSDAATGLSYMQQRYYDPQLGLFLSVDPVSPNNKPGSAFNRYRYAAGNPYRFVDPDGRQERAAERHADSVASSPSAYDTFGPAALAVTTAIVRATPVVGPAVASAMSGSINSAQPLALPAPAAPSAQTPAAAPATPSGPSYVISSNGTAFPVPTGASGPTPVINPAGKQTGVAFTGGAGGSNGQVATMRMMDPTPPRGNSPGYPAGYIKYENAGKQGVDPLSGKTLPNSKSHFPVR
ncbi:RHS repeat-associated core domain-containing protein [Stenotrophomonas maltophilia]|uniref:RHS repeat-associated core domain-containing protein n=1 Tax=Stenotrophomonas maltophilia TaxID=40324 RepID=UPI0010767349|nr:RHS repeat-associated core domain-containing protein [Stenotrophomonas maltophilia]TFZ44634.1 RHS repeat-associated core domain-containing protein [Stenotrophomonas maltophilia]